MYRSIGGGNKKQWEVFRHNGPFFPEEYVPHKIPVTINNQDIMRTLVSKNTEDSLGFTADQLTEMQNLINAVGVTSEDKAMSQLLRYY